MIKGLNNLRSIQYIQMEVIIKVCAAGLMNRLSAGMGEEMKTSVTDWTHK